MRTRLITLAAILSIAALAAAPLANASGDTSSGGVSTGSGGSAGGGGGGAHGGGGGGGGHFGGGGGGFRGGSVGMRVGGFGGGFRAGGYGGGAGSAAHGGFVSHGFYAPERGYGMVGSEAGGFSRIGTAPRGAHAVGNFAALGPRFRSAAGASELAPRYASAARVSELAPRYASAARAAPLARMPRAAVRLPAVRPGHHPPPAKRPSVMKHHIKLVNNNLSCEDSLCGPVVTEPFCLNPTPEELGNPHYALGPYDCPEPLKVSGSLRMRAR